METVFYNDRKGIKYSYMTGVTPCRVNMFTPFIRHCSQLFFKILDQAKIDYALFAGSAIGLYRDAKNIPWVDDFDIVVLERQIPKIERLTQMFTHYGFHWRARRREKGGGIQVFYYPDHTKNIRYGGTFQCDIFYSYFDRNRHLKNKGKWGLYHERDVKKSWVLPYKRRTFEGMSLPFFGNYLADIRHEYGDIDMSVIHIQHSKFHLHLKQNWQQAYREFGSFVRIAKSNTSKRIAVKSNSKTRERTFRLVHFNNFAFADFVRRVNYLNPERLIIVDLRYLKYVLDLKHYLPKTKISALVSDIYNNWLAHLSLVHEVLTDNNSLLNYFNKHYPLLGLKRVTLLSRLERMEIENIPVMNVDRLPLTPDPLEKVPGKKPVKRPPPAPSVAPSQPIVKKKIIQSGHTSTAVKRRRKPTVFRKRAVRHGHRVTAGSINRWYRPRYNPQDPWKGAKAQLAHYVRNINARRAKSTPSTTLGASESTSNRLKALDQINVFKSYGGA